MIKYNNYTINKMAMDSTIYKMYYGGNLLFAAPPYGDEPTPQPTFNGKFLLKYSNGTSYSAECDSSSAITSAQTSGYTEAFTAVTEITVGNCVSTLGNGSFANRYVQSPNSISAITIGSGVTAIGDYAFWLAGLSGTSQPFALNIPSSVETIGLSAFEMANISAVTFNQEMMTIGVNAFVYCRNLKTATNIPYNALSSGKQQFAECSGLTDVTFNQTNASSYDISIANNAFYNCHSLSSVTLPYATNRGSSSIGQDAFRYCHSLGSITIPRGYYQIKSMAFGNCSGLTSVTFANSSGSPMIIEDSFDDSTARTYTMTFGVVSYLGEPNYTVQADSFGSTVNLHTINVTNYDSLTVSDWATFYAEYGWRYIIDTLHYLTMPYQFTLQLSSTYASTVCEGSDLYGLYPTEIKYNGTSYAYLKGQDGEVVYTEVMIAEGSSECQNKTHTFSAPELYASSGNATAKTFSNDDVTVSSQSNLRLYTSGSQSPRVSGGTNTFTISTDVSINTITIVAYNNSHRNGLQNAFNQSYNGYYESTVGTCTYEGTKYYIRSTYINELETPPSSLTLTPSSSWSAIFIGINVDENWVNNLPTPT